jgi:hypothetical protein
VPKNTGGGKEETQNPVCFRNSVQDHGNPDVHRNIWCSKEMITTNI